MTHEKRDKGANVAQGHEKIPYAPIVFQDLDCSILVLRECQKEIRKGQYFLRQQYIKPTSLWSPEVL